MGMKNVIRRSFACVKTAPASVLDIVLIGGCCKLSAIPIQTPGIEIIKKMHFFSGSGDHTVLLCQIVIKRRGTTALPPDNYKIWHHAHTTGHTSIGLRAGM